MCHLISASHINNLLKTNFTKTKFLRANWNGGRYNIDIIFDGDGNKYALEIDGIYWHGLLLERM